MTCLKLPIAVSCCLASTLAWAAPNATPADPNAQATSSSTAQQPSSAESTASTQPAAGPAPSSPTPPQVPVSAASEVTSEPQTPSSTSPQPESSAPPAAAAAVGPSPYGPPTAQPAPKAPPKYGSAGSGAPETLWDSKYDYAFGGFGGVGVYYSRFGGKNVVLVCGEGAVIIDHALTLGGGGCGQPRHYKAQDFSSAYESDDRVHFGYGGAIARYHFRSQKMVNYSVGLLVGAGGIATGAWDDTSDDIGDREFDVKHSDALFVVEPQVGAYLNITRWLRLAATAGYRVVTGVDTAGLDASEVSGIVAGGQLQAGWF